MNKSLACVSHHSPSALLSMTSAASFSPGSLLDQFFDTPVTNSVEKCRLVIVAATLFTILTGSVWAVPTIFKTFDIPAAHSLPARISVDAEGHIWFIESDGNKIGKFQFNEQRFTKFDIPTTRSFPSDIVVGSDGKVWFTEQDANQLGVFDPVAEVFREFDIPTINSLPYRITSDASGNIWFTQFDGNNLGMFDPVKKVFTEFPIPTPRSQPTGISVDQKGRVWFLETQANKLAMLEPGTGVIQEFVIPSAFEAPKELTIDQSGVIWFAGRKGRKLMGFEPSSKNFMEFKVPDRGVIEGLVVSEDGKIFYSLVHKGKLGIFDIDSKKFFEVEILLGDSQFNDIDIDKNGDIWLIDIRKSVLVMVNTQEISTLWQPG